MLGSLRLNRKKNGKNTNFQKFIFKHQCVPRIAGEYVWFTDFVFFMSLATNLSHKLCGGGVMNNVILEEMKGELGCCGKPIIPFDQHKKTITICKQYHPTYCGQSMLRKNLSIECFGSQYQCLYNKYYYSSTLFDLQILLFMPVVKAFRTQILNMDKKLRNFPKICQTTFN